MGNGGALNWLDSSVRLVMGVKRKKLFLHIGHGKTGTSAVQSFLALSHEELKEAGYLYPFHPSFANALQGRISAGNITVGPDSGNWLRDIHASIADDDGYIAYIYSGESMFWFMDSFFAEYDRVGRDLDVCILLSVRNPLDMLASDYQQNVKRAGEICGYSEFVLRRDCSCAQTVRAAELVVAMEERGIDFKIFNYSSLGRRITSAVLRATGASIPYGSKEFGTVNRSLTGSELLLTRILNAVFGRVVGRRVSDTLVDALPNLAADFPILEPSIEQLVLDRMAPAVDLLNRHLPAEMPLVLEASLGSRARCSDVALHFSQEQLDLARHKVVASLYPKGAAQTLRAVAQKFGTNEAISKDEAIVLLELAKRASPRARRTLQSKIDELQSL